MERRIQGPGLWRPVMTLSLRSEPGHLLRTAEPALGRAADSQLHRGARLGEQCVRLIANLRRASLAEIRDLQQRCGLRHFCCLNPGRPQSVGSQTGPGFCIRFSRN